LASPIAGRTNGKTMYISRQRTLATSSDVWNALRAASADARGASGGNHSKRRINRSGPERGGASAAIGDVLVEDVMRDVTLEPSATHPSPRRHRAGGLLWSEGRWGQ
jgi:hypothetical protein